MKYIDFVFTAEKLTFIGDDGSERAVAKDSEEAKLLFEQVEANRLAISKTPEQLAEEAKAKEDAEAQAKAEADAKVAADQEAKDKADAEAKAQADADAAKQTGDQTNAPVPPVSNANVESGAALFNADELAKVFGAPVTKKGPGNYWIGIPDGEGRFATVEEVATIEATVQNPPVPIV